MKLIHFCSSIDLYSLAIFVVPARSRPRLSNDQHIETPVDDPEASPILQENKIETVHPRVFSLSKWSIAMWTTPETSPNNGDTSKTLPRTNPQIRGESSDGALDVFWHIHIWSVYMYRARIGRTFQSRVPGNNPSFLRWLTSGRHRQWLIRV